MAELGLREFVAHLTATDDGPLWLCRSDSDKKEHLKKGDELFERWKKREDEAKAKRRLYRKENLWPLVESRRLK